jgi:hypothetical protein
MERSRVCTCRASHPHFFTELWTIRTGVDTAASGPSCRERSLHVGQSDPQILEGQTSTTCRSVIDPKSLTKQQSLLWYDVAADIYHTVQWQHRYSQPITVSQCDTGCTSVPLVCETISAVSRWIRYVLRPVRYYLSCLDLAQDEESPSNGHAALLTDGILVHPEDFPPSGVESPRVLDLGCGTGSWCFDLMDHPDFESCVVSVANTRPEHP